MFKVQPLGFGQLTAYIQIIKITVTVCESPYTCANKYVRKKLTHSEKGKKTTILCRHFCLFWCLLNVLYLLALRSNLWINIIVNITFSTTLCFRTECCCTLRHSQGPISCWCMAWNHPADSLLPIWSDHGSISLPKHVSSLCLKLFNWRPVFIEQKKITQLMVLSTVLFKFKEKRAWDISIEIQKVWGCRKEDGKNTNN